MGRALESRLWHLATKLMSDKIASEAINDMDSPCSYGINVPD
jgi:hypothetical protein